MKHHNDNSEILSDDNYIDIQSLKKKPHASILLLKDIIKILKSPDSNKTLTISEDKINCSDGTFLYPILNGSPVLYPHKLIDSQVDNKIPIQKPGDSLIQYFLLSQIKQSGEINVPASSRPYEKLLFRTQKFCQTMTGTVVDVGCDSPSISATIFPFACNYIGLDPFASNKEFRIIGVGEYLPLMDESVDNVVFHTSLDHMLDYHTAIDEAFRVLRPGGYVIIATLVWINKATLLTDEVHFHHFREYEIFGCLSNFNIKDVTRYKSPKNESHRYLLYVKAQKPDNNF